MTLTADQLRVLIAHTRYQWHGGEERVVETEAALLRDAGATVAVWELDNASIDDMGALGRARLAGRALWNRQARGEMARRVEAFAPDVVHVHNTFPLMSPAVYAACRDAAVPVVQTLHNFRLVCPQGMLFRDGGPCTDCVGRTVPLPAVRHRCYRGSLPQSVVAGSVLAVHRSMRTYLRLVDLHLVPSAHARDLLVGAGAIPADRSVVKPNVVAPDPGPRPAGESGDHLAFVGRLSVEKGVADLLAAAELQPGVPLVVVGDGPLAPDVERAAARLEHVSWLGPRPPDETIAVIRSSRGMVVPSRWWETGPRTAIEAFACSVPVIAHDLGPLAALVDHEQSGLLVPVGDVRALGTAMERVWSNPEEASRWGRAGRARYEEVFAPAPNLQVLLAAYDRVIRRRR